MLMDAGRRMLGVLLFVDIDNNAVPVADNSDDT